MSKEIEVLKELIAKLELSIIDELKKDPSIIMAHTDPSEMYQIVAVTTSASAIEYIKNPTPFVIALAKARGYDL